MFFFRQLHSISHKHCTMLKSADDAARARGKGRKRHTGRYPPANPSADDGHAGRMSTLILMSYGMDQLAFVKLREDMNAVMRVSASLHRGLATPGALGVNTNQLHVEEESLVNELSILKDKVKSALSGKGARFGANTRMRGIVTWVAKIGRYNDLTNAAFRHTRYAKFQRWYHIASTKLKAQEVLILSIKLLKPLRFKGSTEVANRIPSPLHHTPVAFLRSTALAHLPVLIEKSVRSLGEVRVRHGRLAIIFPSEARLIPGRLSERLGP
mmetsp:Transcript_28807/g.78651  ORF Transcript_28807/g.78651 Transcript_28807/m.78651 type:complete len:269 (+) Transcript_28807:53-859(+)